MSLLQHSVACGYVRVQGCHASRLTCRCAAPLGGTNGSCDLNEFSRCIPEPFLTTQRSRLEVLVSFLILRSILVCCILKSVGKFALALDGFSFVRLLFSLFIIG